MMNARREVPGTVPEHGAEVSRKPRTAGNDDVTTVINICMKHFIALTLTATFLTADLCADQPNDTDSPLAAIFAARGFSRSEVQLPDIDTPFPAARLENLRFDSIATFDWFPEGPTYRPADGSYFFSGNRALTRVDTTGRLHTVLTEPGGGGTHFLPDGSVLIVGHVGLRRLFPDGRVALLADGTEIGAGNDLSVGIHGEIYMSVPKEGIYRLTAGTAGRLERVSEQGCNGLEVDPSGKFLYVVHHGIQRYSIDIKANTLGEAESVYEFVNGKSGGDGCAFDAWGNFYSMDFRTGTIRVFDPGLGRLIAEIPVGVVPASNLTFGGPDNAELFVTAGAPGKDNCQVVKATVGVTGFCGHVGATEYPVVRFLEQRADVEAFAALPDRIADDDWASPAVTGFVNRYCLDCHSGDDAEQGFVLDSLSLNLHETENFERWSKVFDRVEKGEMPPADHGQPTGEEHAAMVQALRSVLVQADRRRQGKYGRSELRRLSRIEYANSLKDILDLPHLELEEMLPPDGLAYGYAKSAKALDFSHVMVTRYLEVADHALWKALAPRAEGIQRKLIRADLKSVDGVSDTLQTLRVQLKQTTGMPLVGRQPDPTLEVYSGNFQKRDPGYVRDPEPHFDGVATFMHSRANHNIVVKPFQVRQSGYYRLRVHGWGLLNDHGKLVHSDRTETVAFYTPTGRLLGRCDLPPNEPTTSEVTVWLNEGEPIEYLAVSCPNEWFKLGRNFHPVYSRFKAHGIGLQRFEMEGPLPEPDYQPRADESSHQQHAVSDNNEAAWPPESHRRLLGRLELKPTELQSNGLEYRVVVEDPQLEARRLVRRFAARAFQRPLRDGDLDTPHRMTQARLRRGEPFVDAVMAGYRAVLTSPEFLLLQEKPGELDPWALASRLAFFLWNSPPDEDLRKAAATGALLNDQELRRQTDRMLSDPKADRFIEHFLDYWLDLTNIRLTEPDDNLYPEHNALLTESMLEETRAFFAEMIRQDLGAMHVVDSDFLTINQRMAELYGIPNVHGSHTRRVPIPADSVRGGLLTQASLLKITANGTTTSPVVRGTFVMTELLGDPPPPPPAAVAAIEPDISGATTIREQLAKHRSDAACAGCHQKIDPPGFALESFDVMGAFRKNYRATLAEGEKGVDLKFNARPVNYKLGLKVDCGGQLPGGEAFADINEFRERMKPYEEQIARNLLEQFIIYGTGTPVGLADESTVSDMMERLRKSQYGTRSMIHEVVQSNLFRKK